MDDYRAFTKLNGYSFSKKEQDEYLTYNGVTVEELKCISANLNTKISHGCFEENKKKIISMLSKDERIEAYIKGADIEMLEAIAAISMMSMGAVLKSDDYGFNYSIFVTNKRIFISGTNYYNFELNTKVYNLDEIEEVKFNREKLKRNNYTLKEAIQNRGFRWLTKGVLTITVLNAIYSIYEYMVSDYEIMGSLILPKVICLLSFLICLLIIRKLTEPKLRVKMRMKDGKILDFIIVNRDGLSLIKKVLSKL
ncbi:PH domain-containing protein [Clostridium sp.]|uniref:PH domain-containing protein n=1 Tax=Clostridium sp. TaxID=1506 RepID=UPI002FC58309